MKGKNVWVGELFHKYPVSDNLYRVFGIRYLILDTRYEILEHMAKWVIVLSLIGGLVILFFFQKELKTTAVDQSVTAISSPDTVTMVHGFKDGIHRYAGEITLPHSCFSTAIDARRDPKRPLRVVLTILTVDQITGGLNFCFKLPTKYPFETIVEAPTDVTPTLSVDGKEFPVRIIEAPWHDTRGTILNLENIP